MKLPTFVFDLDGTLADTRQLVEQAYQAAGVSMPPDAWGKPAREWIPEDQVDKVHALKQVAYHALIERNGVKRLPAGDFALGAMEHDLRATTYVLTGASRAAAHAVLRACELQDMAIMGAGCTVLDKIDILKNCGYTNIIYFDDNEDAAHRIASDAEVDVIWIGPGTELDNIVGGVSQLWTP